MFTPGFKLFAGLSALGIIGAFVYGLSSGDVTGPDYFGVVDRQAIVGLLSLGWKGNIGSGLGYVVLIFFAGAAALIGGTAVAFRDADVEAVAQLDNSSVIPAAQRPTSPSWWPAAAGLGVGTLLLGLVLETSVFWILGLAMLAVVGVEWALTAWADRSTGSAGTNAALRSRVVSPLEIPILATVATGVIALAVSRILLTVSKNGAVAVAGVVALLIFLLAIVAAYRPTFSRKTMGAIAAALAVGIIALGVLSAAVGPRDIEYHGDHHGDDHSETKVVEE